MKKIVFLVLAAFLALVNIAYAATTTTTTTNWDSAASLERVNKIGQKILSANKLPTQITFNVSDEDHVNAYATVDKNIYVYRGLLEYVQDDQELAAVLSHEIGHVVNAHCAKQTILSGIIANLKPATTNTKLNTGIDLTKELVSLKMSRNDEYDADITGAELMYKAGYNPNAMISILNKICENTIDITSSHPSGINRLVNIYDYMSYTNPKSLTSAYNSDSYKIAMQAIDLSTQARQENAKKQAKWEKKMEKLKQKRIKNVQKAQSGLNGWDASYTILNILSTTSQSN